MSTETELTDKVESQILTSVRAGGYVHISAEAWGISGEVWQQWEHWSFGPQARDRYVEFFQKVEVARAQARLAAETRTHMKDPRTWLKHGPGKEAPGNPGWSALPRYLPAPGEQEFDVFASPVFLQLLNDIRIILTPYPDLLALISAAVAARQGRKPPAENDRLVRARNHSGKRV